MSKEPDCTSRGTQQSQDRYNIIHGWAKSRNSYKISVVICFVIKKVETLRLMSKVECVSDDIKHVQRS